MSSTVLADGQKAYQCLCCNKIFRQKVHMRDHIEAAHIEGVRYICSWPGCEKICKSQPALRMHIKSHKNKQYMAQR